MKEYPFTIKELKALYKFIEHEWIPYSNEELHKVVRRISNIVHSADVEIPDELDRPNSKTT